MTKYMTKDEIIGYLKWWDYMLVSDFDRELELVDNGPNEYVERFMALIGNNQLKQLKVEDIKKILLWCTNGPAISDDEIVYRVEVDENGSVHWFIYDETLDLFYKVVQGRGIVWRRHGENGRGKKLLYDKWMELVKEASK